MKGFPIAPWEHPGANFDPAPHAETRLEIGGKKRRFWLKMRDGVIYFREPTLAPLYAVPRIFDSDLALDAEPLIFRWKREVEAGNYGSYFISHRKFPGTPVHANYCIILREQGSGWIKEHFDDCWQEFPAFDGLSASVWVSKPTFSTQSELICKKMRPHFLNRRVDAALFQSVVPFWTCGDQKTFEDVMRAALRLFAPEDIAQHNWPWNCRGNSSFCAGSVTGSFGGMGTSERSFLKVWELLKIHAAFVGVSWRRASEHPELMALYNPNVLNRGIEKWGDDWRGNWVGEQPHVQFRLPFRPATSQHEKLECAIVLRDFFRERTDEITLQKLLDAAIAN